jgi:hypothetical protein
LYRSTDYPWGGRGEGFIAEELPVVSGAEETGEEQEEGGETEEKRTQVMYLILSIYRER